MARYKDEEEDLDMPPIDENGMPDSTKSKAALLKGARGPTGPTGASGAPSTPEPYQFDESYFNKGVEDNKVRYVPTPDPNPYKFDESYFNEGVENNKAAAPPAAAPPAAPAQSFFDYLPDKDEKGFSALPEAETRDQATERVSFFEQTGQDMKAFVARQDPMFKDAFADQARTGKSTSPLRLPPQPFEGSARREASNYEREANKSSTPPAVRNALMAKAAMIRAGQPSISSPLSRKQEMERGMQLRDALQDTVEMGQQAAGGGGDAVVKGEAGAKEPTLGTNVKGGVGASARTAGGRKKEDNKKTGASAYRDDDKLLGMSDGISNYQYSRVAPLQIMLQDLKSRRA